MSAYRDERNKTWFVQFRYTDWQGKSKSTTKRGFRTKRDALDYEYEFKKNSKEQIDITLNQISERFIEDIKTHTKPSNYIRVEGMLTKWILPFLGHLKLTELTPAALREWQNHMMKTDLKPSSLKTIHRRCSALLNFAVKYYGLRLNPLKITGSMGRSERSKSFWELDEFNKFIRVVDNPKYEICFSLLFYSGMRLGELLALEVGDFDFVQNIINISKSKMLINGEISTPKTIYSVRKIDMPAEIMQTVRRYIDSLDKVPTPLFHMYNSALSVAIHKYAKVAGVKEIRLHDLRHSHASFLIHNGVPITAISKRLGHRSPKITLEVYSHMYEESEEQIVDLLKSAYFVRQNVVKDEIKNKK